MRNLLTTLILLLSQTIVAQEKVWTLEDCMQYAVKYNPQCVRQEAQNKIYRADQVEAVGGFLPSLSASTNIYSRFGRGIDPETNTYISTSTFGNGYEIYSSMTLFDGLAQIYQAKKAKINRLMGKEQLQETKDKIALETMELFFNVLYYKGTVGLAQQQLDESIENLKRIERMKELGLKSAPDVTEIRAKEAEDRYLLTRQINMLNLEIIKLKEKMYLPIDEDLTVADVENQALDGASGENAAEIFQTAKESLPKLLSSEKSMSAREMEYKVARSLLFPTLSLGAGFSTGFSRLMDGSTYTSFKEQLKNRQGSYVQVSLSIPLFSRFSNTSEIKRSKQRLIIAKSQHEETLRQVYGEIEQAVADVKGLSDEYQSVRKKTEAMLAAHKTNLRKYDEGLIDAFELATSANRLLNSRIEELHTSLNFQLKRKLLNYYEGDALIK
ncbi:MAG: TolC family protein [Tannerella sp.]|jgi:outer membrane protein TolC|nr:TolC family protein [Tannerella sp.]